MTRSPATICAAAAIVCLLLGQRTGAEPAVREDSEPPSAREIVDRAFANLYGFNSIQIVTITAGPESQRFTRSAQVIRSAANSDLNRMLVRFLGPPDMRGTGLLLLENDSFQYDVFLYQPAFNKVRRVSVYQRRDRFFGTDLAFEDLEGKRSEQWGVNMLRSERVGDRDSYVIQLKPEGFPSGYERVVMWFDREKPVMLQAEFYRDGRLFKTAKMPANRVVEQGGFFVPTRLEFSANESEKTIVEISSIELLDSIPDARFSLTALETGNDRRDAHGLLP